LKRSRKRWSKGEDAKLREGVQVMGPKSWKAIADTYLGGNRSDVQCLHRWSKVLKPGLVKGLWTNEEDAIILQCIDKGMVKWTDIADCVSGRSSKQCRERWSNHLDPSLKKGNWDEEEDKLLAVAQSVIGNCWSRMAKAIPGRSENAIKNRWNSAVHKKAQAGISHSERAVLTELILKRIETIPGGSGDLAMRRGYVNVQHQGKENNLLKEHVARLQNDKKSPPKKKQKKTVSNDGISAREMQLVQEAFAAGSRQQQMQQQPQLNLNVSVLQLVNDDLSKQNLNIGNIGGQADFMGFGGRMEEDEGNETDDNSDEGYETDDNSAEENSPLQKPSAVDSLFSTASFSLNNALSGGEDLFMGTDMGMGGDLLAFGTADDLGTVGLDMFEGVF
jgi:hypothetical protein